MPKTQNPSTDEHLALLEGLHELIRREKPRREKNRKARHHRTAVLQQHEQEENYDKNLAKRETASDLHESSSELRRPRAVSSPPRAHQFNQSDDDENTQVRKDKSKKKPLGVPRSCRGSMDLPIKAIKEKDLAALQDWVMAIGIPFAALNDILPRTGRTLLHETCMYGENEKMLRLLVSCRGIDVDKATILGRCTPLMFASLEGHNNLVRVLINSGANVLLRNTKGEAALHLASDPFVAQTLLNAGADPFGKTCAGLTPSQCAAMRQDDKVYDVLERHVQSRMRQDIALRKVAETRRRSHEQRYELERQGTIRSEVTRKYRRWRTGLHLDQVQASQGKTRKSGRSPSKRGSSRQSSKD